MYKYDYKSYLLPSNIFQEYFNIVIYYKSMRIEWVLEKFSLKEINKFAQELQSEKNLIFDKKTKSFVCKNKWGYKKLEMLLMKHYYNNISSSYFPENLLELSLYNFVSNNYEWKNLN